MKAYESMEIAESVTTLAADIFDWALNKGFWGDEWEVMKNHNVPVEILNSVREMKKCQKLLLIVSEISELMEGLRATNNIVSLGHFTNEEEEAADVMIRLLDYCGRYKLRIGAALMAKMAKNEGRPFLHGKTF